MKKDSAVFIGHILESIDLIENYAKGKSHREFIKSKQLKASSFKKGLHKKRSL
ncbi:hypothetical protein HZC34_00035 [Candidatus Saganbacteria bacterium]|nr:hypothetical protein [Candidatus Saganbacteria bacterium]